MLEEYYIFAPPEKTYTCMYQKFIITHEGVLRFGNVYQHRELLQWGEDCPYGGGLWKVDEARGAVLLYGRSFAFGPPCLEQVRRIEWAGLGGIPRPLFFLPHWPSEESLVPVYVNGAQKSSTKENTCK